MLNSDQIIEIGEARRAHMRQEAQHARLIKEARSIRPRPGKQFLKWSGDILIRLGYKLQGYQQQPTVHSGFQASRFTPFIDCSEPVRDRRRITDRLGAG